MLLILHFFEECIFEQNNITTFSGLHTMSMKCWFANLRILMLRADSALEQVKSLPQKVFLVGNILSLEVKIYLLKNKLLILSLN